MSAIGSGDSRLDATGGGVGASDHARSEGAGGYAGGEEGDEAAKMSGVSMKRQSGERAQTAAQRTRMNIMAAMTQDEYFAWVACLMREAERPRRGCDEPGHD